MSKITFRADDDLVDQLETLDASKSEVMREALRAYLANAESRHGAPADDRATLRGESGSIDDLLQNRVDALVSQRLREREPREPQDVNVSITLDGETVERNTNVTPQTDVSSVSGETDHKCGQCGETVAADHVYCPNCGEKASRRSFCECGDELRTDWAFCPACGRRTPAADVLDSN